MQATAIDVPKFDQATGFISGKVTLRRRGREDGRVTFALGKIRATKPVADEKNPVPIPGSVVLLSLKTEGAGGVKTFSGRALLTITVDRKPVAIGYSDPFSLAGTGASTQKSNFTMHAVANAEGEGHAVLEADLTEGAQLTVQWLADLAD